MSDESCLTDDSLTDYHLLGELKKGNMFGYIQRDIEVPEKLRTKTANLPPISKNTLFNKNDIVGSLRTFAGEEGRMFQPREKIFKLHFTKR